MDDLKSALAAERLASYQRLRGGFPIPLAGAAYWLVLTWAGHALDLAGWLAVAMWGSGLIFPLALAFAKLFGNQFMQDRTAISDLLVPAFVSMLLFFPTLASVIWTAPELAPLVLAIGMSVHWPVIGWMYGRTALFTGHAVMRAALAFLIWNWMPEGRDVLLPLSVALVYLATVLLILVDTRRLDAHRPPVAA